MLYVKAYTTILTVFNLISSLLELVGLRTVQSKMLWIVHGNEGGIHKMYKGVMDKAARGGEMVFNTLKHSKILCISVVLPVFVRIARFLRC